MGGAGVMVIWLAACASPRGELLSPSDGAVVTRAPTLPILVRLDPEWDASAAQATLDEAPLDTPLAIFGHRNDRWGGGIDWLASLPMVDVEPGSHTLEVAFADAAGRTLEVSSEFVYSPPESRVTLRTEGTQGEAVAARVRITDVDDQPVLLWGPDAVVVDPVDRDATLYTAFVMGERTIALDPGIYTFTAFRGVREAVDVQVVNVEGDRELVFSVPRVVDTPEQVTADLHVHTGYSGDSFVPDRVRYESLVTAGLDVVVITDHSRIIDPSEPLAEVLGDLGSTWGIAGVEAATKRIDPDDEDDLDSIGHINAFPLVDGAMPDAVPETIGHYLDSYRDRQKANPYPGVGDELLLQLNHPRGIQFQVDESPTNAHAMFELVGYDVGLPLEDPHNEWMIEPVGETGTVALDFDAMEIVNRFSWALYLEVRADWFALLNQGHPMTGTGNSDSHATEVELAGFPVNLVRCCSEEDPAGLVDAIREGQVTVSTGPVVDVEVLSDDGVGLPGDEIAGSSVTVQVRVRAAPWVPVHRVRLVVNGHVVRTSTPSQFGVDLVETWQLELDRDSWILAEAGWPLYGDEDDIARVAPTYAAVAPGYVPLGFTNPVFVDADSDGLWSAPGL